MATPLRLVLWIVWCGAMGVLWWAQWVGAGPVLAACALGLILFAWPGSTARRRRSGELRYVELVKQPIS